MSTQQEPLKLCSRCGGEIRVGEDSPGSGLEEILSLLQKLPDDYYLKIEMGPEEKDDRPTGEKILIGTLFQTPPEDGWPNRAAYFRHPPDNWDAAVTDFPWKHDDSCLAGMSVPLKDPAKFWKILDGMLKDVLKISEAPPK